MPGGRGGGGYGGGGGGGGGQAGAGLTMLSRHPGSGFQQLHSRVYRERQAQLVCDHAGIGADG